VLSWVHMYGILNDDHVEMLEDRFGMHKLRKRSRDRGFSEHASFILKTAETLGAAGTMGFLNAKHAKPNRNAIEFGGVPADLTFGVIGNVIALSPYVGDFAEHLHNLATGLLCAYGVRMGMMWGAESRGRRALQAGMIQANIQQQGQPQNGHRAPQALPPQYPRLDDYYRQPQQQPVYQDWPAAA
jgi:hypothetical protein